MDREYVVHNGERATIQLADGSRVILGPGSRLRYPSHFTGASRTVTLEGTAFFNVAHDPAHPFTVTAGDAVIQELGTAFSTTAYPGDSTVSIVVAEGRVAVRSARAPLHSGTALARGDMASFDRTGLTTVTHNANLNTMLAWTHGVLIFDDVPMREVARTLGRWYDVDFVFASAAVANRPITLSAGPESLNEVLMQLSTVLDVHISQHGRIVTVAE
jgi:ferric-dicitrate binding protein FerR (iron transport regulator)